MGGAKTTGAPVRRPLPDARQAPPGVAVGVQIIRSSGGSGNGSRRRYVGADGREVDTEEGMADGEEEWEPTKWEIVVELVQLDFRDGVLMEEAA